MSRSIAGAVLLVCSVVPAAAQVQPDRAKRPNVVLIVTDDVGYGDFGPYGVTDIRTPNVDRLAREGVKLTDFYAAPVCTPTRAMLMTGRYQQRVGLEVALPSAGPRDRGLLPTGRSLPQLLKKNGYATGLVGKWHLGWKPEFGPNEHGFDYFFGFKSGAIDFYTHEAASGLDDLFENTTPVTVDGYMTDLITARAVRFIEQHASEPFFLDVAYNAAHWPFQPPDRHSEARAVAFEGPLDTPTRTRKDYAAMLERADAGVGQILQALAKLGLERNTLVIFTNDNGGEWLSRNTPLSNRKGTLWEGGIRVPAIFRWPGRLPAGRTSGRPGIFMDITASILAATNTPVPPEARLEGMNLIPILSGQAAPVERTLFWRTQTQKAVRRGDWKLLVQGNAAYLFNLRADIGEHNDLARDRVDLIRTLWPLIDAWEADVDAERTALTR
ncbi:MAG: sulfatase-like hydrolase/transferase [Acidobacteria bacterium]|nr:sulfatase-like hydrolase/transferase [Acidobacteriota bacterium]